MTAGSTVVAAWPRATVAAVAAIVVLLGGLVAARRAGLDGGWEVAVSAAVGIATIAIARAGGASWDDLGLSPAKVPAGLKLGGLVFAAVLAVMVTIAVIPATRSWLQDSRVDVSGHEMLLTVLVATPIGVVLLEELAFRGALLGLFLGHTGQWRAALMSSVLFGLWHVTPTLSTAGGNAATAGLAGRPLGMLLLVAGMVVAMTAAGLVLCWLRLRSGSVVAPALTHIATNSVTFAVAWVVARR